MIQTNHIGLHIGNTRNIFTLIIKRPRKSQEDMDIPCFEINTRQFHNSYLVSEWLIVKY